MTKLAAWASLLSLLGVGVIIGGLGMHLLYAGDRGSFEHRPLRGDGPPGGWHPRDGHGPLVGHLSEELELTDEQVAEIEVLLEQVRAEGERMRREMRPKLLAQMQRAHQGILDVLTDEQRERFETMSPDPEELARDIFRRMPGGPRSKGKRPRRERNR